MKLKQHALAKVGEWTPGLGVNITDMSAFHDTAPYNITLVVVTIVVNIFHFIIYIYIINIIYKWFIFSFLVKFISYSVFLSLLLFFNLFFF